MTWADVAPTMATMQPTMNTSSSTSIARPSRRNRRAAALLGVSALALSSLLTACGGSSDASSSDGATTPTTAASTDGGGTSSDETTTTGVAGAPDLDICAEITEDDMAAILPEADLTAVERNQSIPAPNCRYTIEISGGGTTIQADVISIVWNEPGFFDGQQELQTDEQEVAGVGADAFSINDGGTILVRGKSGAFQITRGVELTTGGTAASPEQMTAIAKLVAEL